MHSEFSALLQQFSLACCWSIQEKKGISSLGRQLRTKSSVEVAVTQALLQFSL